MAEATRVTAPTAGQAAYEAYRAAVFSSMPKWDELSHQAKEGWEAAAQAAIATQPDFAEHPACDAHRWYAVVKHVGSFAYGFAATSDGLRVYDDVSEFEYAKARDFE